MSKNKIVGYLRKQWKDWRKTVFFIVFVVIPVKSSIADFNWVPTGSMNPTILEGDLVYVDKLAYDLRAPLTFYRLAKWASPARGDIVICFSPQDGTRLVKRVIGLPGDTLESRANLLFINGRALAYTKADKNCASSLNSELKDKAVFATEQLGDCRHTVMGVPAIPARRDFGPVIIPAGSYFVMGDNRDLSRDSRFFGFIDAKAIVGKARGVIVSFDITDKYQPRPERFFAPLN